MKNDISLSGSGTKLIVGKKGVTVTGAKKIDFG
jgi:hypothetical protein